MLELEEVRSAKKAIATTRSFEGTISDYEKIKEEYQPLLFAVLKN